MPKYDVVVIGAGAAGLPAAAILAKQGKKVLLVEKNGELGGRAMSYMHRGHKLMLGAHMLEDSGSGLTKIMQYLGKELDHGIMNDAMPVWKDGRWRHAQELYQSDKTELKRAIRAVIETPWAELEKWDNQVLRSWMLEHTRSEGVIELWEFLSMLECLTDNWWDHSASDNLFVRKMHYGEKRIAGYSFWPKGGFDKIFEDLRDVLLENGGELRLNTPVSRILVDNHRVLGVEIEVGERLAPGEYPDRETVEADHVVCTVPVWDVLRLFDDGDLPAALVDKIKLFAQDKYRVCWLGFYVAAKEPVYALTEHELCAWWHTPRAGLSGFALQFTTFDPSVSPPGEYLFSAGGAFDAAYLHDQRWIARTYQELEQDFEDMFPATRHALWKRRHIVSTFGIIQKPGLVGTNRVDMDVPGVDGLYFANENYRSRGVGVDRAARAGLSVSEKILGRRIPEFMDSWHY